MLCRSLSGTGLRNVHTLLSKISNATRQHHRTTQITCGSQNRGRLSPKTPEQQPKTISGNSGAGQDLVQCQKAGIGPTSWHRALNNALLIVRTIWNCRELFSDSTPYWTQQRHLATDVLVQSSKSLTRPADATRKHHGATYWK